MYYVCKPTKIALYINTVKKGTAAIKKELGCDAIINGGIYDLSKYTPYCWLRKDGKTLHSENWSDFGYAWNTNALEMVTSNDCGYFKYFITCVALILNGNPIIPLTYPQEMGGTRGRTAIGVMPDGSTMLYCTKDGTRDAKTPEQLQTEMKKLGCVSALMLDGGTSSRCIMPTGTIGDNKNRPYVHNYIAVWTISPYVEKPTTPVSITQCPYAEPSGNIRWGSIGNGAKWVQWQINRHGASLTVDGLFFAKSVAALRDFQRSNGLTADGICGPLTREALK